jgi:hypothetical protein
VFGRSDSSFSGTIQCCFLFVYSDGNSNVNIILEIYSAFKGENNQNQEIESYVNYILDSNISMRRN